MRIWKRKEVERMWQIPEGELDRARKDLNYSENMLSPKKSKKNSDGRLLPSK